MGEAERRRRRLRHHGEAAPPTETAGTGADGTGGTTASTAPVHDDVVPRSPRGGRPGLRRAA
ncbi:hypothetical protein ACWECH_27975, partial [Micromonospora aurantiaca (nom. illeg.)]